MTWPRPIEAIATIGLSESTVEFILLGHAERKLGGRLTMSKAFGSAAVELGRRPGAFGRGLVPRRSATRIAISAEIIDAASVH